LALLLRFSLFLAGVFVNNQSLLIIGGVIGLVSLIWILPLAIIAVGILYREMLGVNTPTSVVIEKEA
jgi:hypothetical protein